MSWDDGICERCARESQVIHVDGHGPLCVVCLDYVAEHNDSDAQKVNT